MQARCGQSTAYFLERLLREGRLHWEMAFKFPQEFWAKVDCVGHRDCQGFLCIGDCMGIWGFLYVPRVYSLGNLDLRLRGTLIAEFRIAVVLQEAEARTRGHVGATRPASQAGHSTRQDSTAGRSAAQAGAQSQASAPQQNPARSAAKTPKTTRAAAMRGQTSEMFAHLPQYKVGPQCCPIPPHPPA